MRGIFTLILIFIFASPSAHAGLFSGKGGGGSLFNVFRGAIERNIVYIDFASTYVYEADTDVLTIPVKLSAASGETVAARIKLTGAKSQLEDWGFGKNYTLTNCSYDSTSLPYEESYIDVTFPPGTTRVDLNLAIVNNPAVDYDKQLSLVVFSATNASRRTWGPVITIVDAQRAATIDVTQNSVSNNDTDVSSALGTLLSNTYNTYVVGQGKGAIVYFPAGTYQVASVTLPPGITLYGAGAATVIKRLAGSETRQVRNESVFWTQAYSGASDSAAHGLANLTLDGGSMPFMVTFDFDKTGAVDAGDYFYFNGDSNNKKFTYRANGTSPCGADEIEIGLDDQETADNTKAKILARSSSYGAYSHATNTKAFAIYLKDQPGFIHYATSGIANDEISISNTEHQSLLYGTCPTGAGRRVVKIENVTMQNSPSANGMFITGGTDLNCYRVNNSELMARGGFCLAGGNCIFRIKNCFTDFFHVEADNTGNGSDPYLLTSVIEDLTAQLANFATAGAAGSSANSTFSGKNITVTRAWGLTGNGLVSAVDSFKFQDCHFTMGASPGYVGWTSSVDAKGTYITSPTRIDFHNCSFTVNDTNIGAIVRGALPYINGTYPWPAAGGGRMVFDTCTFNGSRTGSDGLITAFINRLNDVSQNENNNILQFNDCTFGTGLDYALMTGLPAGYGTGGGTGGIYEFTNPMVNSAKFFWLNGHNGGPTYSNFNVTITGGTYTGMGTWGHQYGYTSAASGSDNILRMSGVSITATQNVISHNSGIGSTNVARPSGTGVMRTITGCTSSPVTAKPAGYCKDASTYDRAVYNNTNYKCTASGAAGTASWAAE